MDLAVISRGLLRGPVREHDDVARWREALASPLLRARRIGITHTASGAGATTLAMWLTQTLATTRSVLTVDMAPDGPGSLGSRLGATRTAPERSRREARRSDEATSGLSVAHGAHVLWPSGASDLQTWLTEAAPISRFFDVTLTDFGVLDPRSTLPAAASLCDVMCVVSPADRLSAEVNLSLVRGLDTIAEQPAGVLALVDRSGRDAATAEALASRPDETIVAIPHDRAGAARGLPSRAASRVATLRLSAVLTSRGGVR